MCPISASYGTPGLFGGTVSTPDMLPKSLMSVRDVKKLAISIHGSIEYLKERLNARKPLSLRITRGKPSAELLDCEARELLIEAQLDPSQPMDRITYPCYGHRPANKYPGVASMDFPVLLPNRTFENGIWCFGC